MHGISINARCEIGTNRAFISFLGIRRAHQFAILGNGIVTFQHLDHDRTGRHELDEIVKEGTILMHRIKAPRLPFREPCHAGSNDLEFVGFEAGINLANYIFRYSIRFDDGQGAFGCHFFLHKKGRYSILSPMNPNLHRLQPYPFEKLARLFSDITPVPDRKAIRLSIGEPQHATPEFIRESLAHHLDGLSHYPATQGSDELRCAIRDWITRRYGIPPLDPATEILPVNGSREALFSFVQCIANVTLPDGLVLCPNPFYQIYEGAACLAGLTPVFCNQTPDNDFAFDIAALPDDMLRRVQLVYVCSPGNPTGKVLSLQAWQTLFELSDRYDFVIASDECYSEIYFDEAQPPLGGLEAAYRLGRDWRNLVMFSSLSKRSNVPGLRSGFVAGDAAILEKFRLYRTYHGCAMNPAVQSTSAAAWRDETHVQKNRILYREKFEKVLPLLPPHLEVGMPDAGFYLWARIKQRSDTEFARELYRQYNVIVLPGSFLAREAHGFNPGANFIRIALVAPLDECLEAAHRIADFCRSFE